MKSKPLQEHIDEVMDWFDFEKVEKCMTALKWEWFLDEGANGQPTIAEMRATVRRLMKEAYNKKLRLTATGGFYVYYQEHDDGDYFAVHFSASNWDTAQ